MREIYSSSNVHRRDLCTGSLEMESGLPESPDTEYSIEGRLLHQHLQFPETDRSKLTIDQREAVERAESIASEFKSKHLGDASDIRVVKEFKLWFRHNGKPLYPGTPDEVAISVKRSMGIIVDYKMGWLDVTPATGNLQLRSYTVQADRWLDKEINDWYAIIIPRMGEPHWAHYTREDVEASYRQLLDIWKTSQKRGNPRTPSPEACKYCRGHLSGVCQESRKSLELTIREADLATESTIKGLLLKSTPEQRADLLDRMKIAESYIEMYRSAAKEIIAEDPNAIPGWGLKDGKTRVTIYDPIKAWELVGDDLFDYEEWSQATSISIPELVTILASKTEMSTKAAKELLVTRLERALVRSTDAKSLTRVK